MSSKKAAKRIGQQSKPIKIIIMLRNPTERAYSQYFHMLRSGRAIFTFEDTIKFSPYSILNRSLYKTQIENYLKYIPHDRIKIVVFEDFIKNVKSNMNEISAFLEIDFNKFNFDIFKLHANKSKLPKSISLQLLRNRNFRAFGNIFYIDHFPLSFKVAKNNNSIFLKFIHKLHHFINPQKEMIPPTMNPSTKDFLDDFLKSELSGINELIGQDVLSKWF